MKVFVTGVSGQLGNGAAACLRARGHDFLGVSSRELAEAVFRLRGKDVTVTHVSTEDYGARALRPKNSRLSMRSLDAGGFKRLPEWEQSLKALLKTAVWD